MKIHNFIGIILIIITTIFWLVMFFWPNPYPNPKIINALFPFANLLTIIGISLLPRIILIIIGIILSILALCGFGDVGAGFLLAFGCLLVIIGILSLFSIIGSNLVFAGLLILMSWLWLESVFLKPYYSLRITIGEIISYIAFGLFAVGILYGIIEGILKLIRKFKK